MIPGYVHPEYKKRQDRTRRVGALALGAGALGVVLPVVPGMLFVLVGLSIFSVHSAFAHRQLARLRARFPELEVPLRRIEAWLYHVLDLATHTHEYVDIPVRNGKHVRAIVERSEIAAEGIAILVHSASGTMDSPLMQTLAEVFRARGYTVVRFNATRGIDVPEAYPTFTVTGYVEDLADVLAWVRAQSWGAAPVTVVGHSIGGLVAGVYAAEEGSMVASLYMVAPTLSGSLLARAYEQTGVDMEAWKAQGIREVSHPLSGERCSQGYCLLTDAQQYDLMASCAKLSMPVCVLCGDTDQFAPEANCKAFIDAVGSPARCVVVPGMPHTPTERSDIQKLTSALC